MDSDLLFRAPKSTLKREKDYLRESIRFSSELVGWLDQRRQLPPVKLRPLSKKSDDLVSAARKVRMMFGIEQDLPIDFLTHLLERTGVVVVVRRRQLAEPLITDDADEGGVPSNHQERHEGCSAWVGEFRERPLIAMRALESWEKTRWVLAHEVGHLFLHASRAVVTEQAEREASIFASELLAPISSVEKDLPQVVTLAALIDVKFKWGISLAALIRHLHENKVIDDRRKQTLYTQLYTRRNPETGRTYGVTEPGWDSRSPERPRIIAAWLSHTVGTAIPEAVASAIGHLPPDLLTEILSEQRPAPAAAQAAATKRSARQEGKVIQMNRRPLQLDLLAQRSSSS